MPIASPEKYAEMIDAAKNGAFAFPAINVTSSQTLNAAIRGFAEAGSDGIVQVSTGGAAYFSGSSVKDMVAGSLAFAAFAREVAKKYSVNIALHTDHCPQDKLEGFVLPLLDASEAEVKAGRDPIFNSHMWDGSAETLDDNIKLAVELLAMSKKANTILEIEIGAVGGEEDGVVGEINDTQKPGFLSGAKALLMPIDWPEPFGLVMIEAMACATPVIAFRCGSVPEIIDEGVSGFIVESEDEAVAAVARLKDLDRRRVRAAFDVGTLVPSMRKLCCSSGTCVAMQVVPRTARRPAIWVPAAGAYGGSGPLLR